MLATWLVIGSLTQRNLCSMHTFGQSPYQLSRRLLTAVLAPLLWYRYVGNLLLYSIGLKDTYTYWQKQRKADKEGATGSERDLRYIAVLKPNVLLTVCLFLKNFLLLDNLKELLVRWLVYSYSDHIFIYTVTNMHVMLITLSILCLRILSLVCFHFDFFRLNLIIMPTIITISITMINI